MIGIRKSCRATITFVQAVTLYSFGVSSATCYAQGNNYNLTGDGTYSSPYVATYVDQNGANRKIVYGKTRTEYTVPFPGQNGLTILTTYFHVDGVNTLQINGGEVIGTKHYHEEGSFSVIQEFPSSPAFEVEIEGFEINRIGSDWKTEWSNKLDTSWYEFGAFPSRQSGHALERFGAIQIGNSFAKDCVDPNVNPYDDGAGSEDWIRGLKWFFRDNWSQSSEYHDSREPRVGTNKFVTRVEDFLAQPIQSGQDFVMQYDYRNPDGSDGSSGGESGNGGYSGSGDQ